MGSQMQGKVFGREAGEKTHGTGKQECFVGDTSGSNSGCNCLKYLRMFEIGC